MNCEIVVAPRLVLGVILGTLANWDNQFTTCFKAEETDSWVEKWLYG